MRQKKTLTIQESRAYQRLVSGLTIGCRQGAYYRFMTLTTAKGVNRDINKDFDILKKRIRRATWQKDRFSGFKFNRYFKLKTAEGNGVLHIIYWGNFIPQNWLSHAWEQIHKSEVVDIRSAYGNKNTKVKGLVGYLLTDYLTKQPIIRMSYGWKWAWKGLAKSWDHVRKSQKFLRRAGSMKDEAVWADNVKHHSTVHYLAHFASFKNRYRDAGLETFKATLRQPPNSSTQIKFCTPKGRVNKRICQREHATVQNLPLQFSF